MAYWNPGPKPVLDQLAAGKDVLHTIQHQNPTIKMQRDFALSCWRSAPDRYALKFEAFGIKFVLPSPAGPSPNYVATPLEDECSFYDPLVVLFF